MIQPPLIQGIFLVDKPTGITSHDVVARLRKLTGERRIGHAGTLDPLASGLMLVAIGRAYTKQLSKYVGLDKSYIADITLGATSETDDAEGPIRSILEYQPTIAELEVAIKSLTGEQLQLPPQYSAKKIAGKKAYELARAGETAEVKPKRITVYKLELLEYHYPECKVNCEVSSGTYIRSIARDLGEGLKTGAYLSGLRRTRVGQWAVEQAVGLSGLTNSNELWKYKVETI